MEHIPVSPEIDALAKVVVDCAYKVHSAIGPGLLESVYQACLAYEIRNRGVRLLTEVVLPVTYDGLEIEAGLRLDMLVGDVIILELKSVEKLLPVHDSQLLTYLRLSRLRLGFLVNFNVSLFRDGVKRFVI